MKILQVTLFRAYTLAVFEDSLEERRAVFDDSLKHGKAGP